MFIGKMCFKYFKYDTPEIYVAQYISTAVINLHWKHQEAKQIR